MKKITRCALAIGIIFSSCSKEPNWARNYSQPIHSNNPTDIQGGSNISWYEGMSDEECIRKIKSFDSYDPNKPIFLSPILYDLSGNEITKTNTITNPKSNHWRGISLANSRGKEVSFKITNANIIKSIMYDLRVEE